MQKEKSESLTAYFEDETKEVVVSKMNTGIKTVSSVQFDALEKAIDKGDAVESETTATYFKIDEKQKFLGVVQGFGEMETADKKTGEVKKVECVYFFARKHGEKTEPKRYIDASTILLKNLKEIGEGKAFFVEFMGKIDTGETRYNDYRIWAVV